MAEEKFNVEGVRASVEQLETAFTDFGKLLDDVNLLLIHENVNIGPDKSSVYGDVGEKLLKVWDENASTFGNFKANFENWSKLITIIEANNLEFEKTAIEIYKSNGGNLAGVQSSRDKLFAEQAVSSGNSAEENTYEYYDGNGNKVTFTKDNEGNIESKVITGKDNSVTQKVFYDANGNMAVVSYDENGQPVPKFYDKDGKVLFENPGFGNEISEPLKVDGIPSDLSSTNETTTLSTNSLEDSSVTYRSGDTVEIKGTSYNVYGAIEKPNGEVVMLYGDKNGNLLYQNENGELENVTYSYTTYSNGGRQFAEHTENATVNDLGTTVNNGYANLPKNLEVGDYTLTSTDQVATSINCSNGLFPEKTGNGQSVGAFIDNQVAITTDGSLKTSYSGQIDGTTVNGSKIITATAMDDFKAYTQTNSGGDITLRIPQGQYVQWDSPSGGTGYEFSTGNGAVYLRWDSSAAGGQGAYHIVDEYGNVTNNRDFTLDGFNSNGGINGGVWK